MSHFTRLLIHTWLSVGKFTRLHNNLFWWKEITAYFLCLTSFSISQHFWKLMCTLVHSYWNISTILSLLLHFCNAPSSSNSTIRFPSKAERIYITIVLTQTHELIKFIKLNQNILNMCKITMLISMAWNGVRTPFGLTGCILRTLVLFGRDMTDVAEVTVVVILTGVVVTADADAGETITPVFGTCWACSSLCCCCRCAT